MKKIRSLTLCIIPLPFMMQVSGTVFLIFLLLVATLSIYLLIKLIRLSLIHKTPEFRQFRLPVVMIIFYLVYLAVYLNWGINYQFYLLPYIVLFVLALVALFIFWKNRGLLFYLVFLCLLSLIIGASYITYEKARKPILENYKDSTASSDEPCGEQSLW